MAKQQAPQAIEAQAPEAPAAPRATPKEGELVQLFQQYEAANAAVAKADEAYTKAMAGRSAVVEKFAAFGKNFTSPTGLPLQVSVSTNKETGAKNYFFRSTKEEPLKIK